MSVSGFDLYPKSGSNDLETMIGNIITNTENQLVILTGEKMYTFMILAEFNRLCYHMSKDGKYKTTMKNWIEQTEDGRALFLNLHNWPSVPMYLYNLYNK